MLLVPYYINVSNIITQCPCKTNHIHSVAGTPQQGKEGRRGDAEHNLGSARRSGSQTAVPKFPASILDGMGPGHVVSVTEQGARILVVHFAELSP